MTDEFDQLQNAGKSDFSKSDQVVEQLEAKLVGEQDARMEERFLFVLITVVLLNVIFLRDFGNWTGPLVIGIMELVFLLVLARKCGVEEVHLLLDKVLDVAKPSKS